MDSYPISSCLQDPEKTNQRLSGFKGFWSGVLTEKHVLARVGCKMFLRHMVLRNVER